MRFIDIAVATLVGTSALTGMLAWNPHLGDSDSHRIVVQAHLRGVVLDFVNQHGIAWLLNSSPKGVCADVVSASTPSAVLFANFSGFSCGTPPRPGSAVSTLEFRLLPSEVILGAWSSGLQ